MSKLAKVKRFPFTIFYVSLVIINILLFSFYVPAGGDLISAHGDYLLGQWMANLLFICIGLDVLLHVFRKKETDPLDSEK